MQRATTNILYFETGPDNEPTMWVEPRKLFEVQTQINRRRLTTKERNSILEVLN